MSQVDLSASFEYFRRQNLTSKVGRRTARAKHIHDWDNHDSSMLLISWKLKHFIDVWNETSIIKTGLQPVSS